MTKEEQQTKSHVYVALSGGVDSAVSAALLKQQGYQVTGAFIKTWQPEFLDCRAPVDREDARRVAANLDIPFTTIDLEDEYKRDVAEYMIEEYREGRVPNPDVMCNARIKFGAFLKEALERGADMIATGHYARIREARNVERKTRTYELLRGVDGNKDQSYFLWTLGQEQLSRTLFPVGGYTKPQVRELAAQFGLPVADKKDSQGVCFLGKLDMKKFLSHYIEPAPGDVLDTAGNRIGTHDGALFYTLGQRHGFEVTKKTPDTGPLYVVAKDLNANTVTVSELDERASVDSTRSVSLSGENWISNAQPTGEYQVQFRYRQYPIQANLSTEDGNTVITFDEPQQAVAPGQSLVVYSGDTCIGGGNIEAAYRNGALAAQ